MIQAIKHFFSVLFGPVQRYEDVNQTQKVAPPVTVPAIITTPALTNVLTKRKKPMTPTVEANRSGIPLGPSTLLQKFGLAIQAFEGYIAPNAQYPEGTTSYRFNNPGNLVYAGQAHAVPVVVQMPTGPHTFAHFDTYANGFTALENEIRSVGLGESPVYKHEAMVRFGLPSSAMLTIVQFFAIYSPSSDGNDPDHYADTVSIDIGVNANTFTMQQLVAV